MIFDVDGWTALYLVLAGLGIGALVVAAAAAARALHAVTAHN